MTAAADPVEAARAALAGGEPVQAVHQIRLLLGYPAGVTVPADRAAEALSVLADAAAASDYGALAEASRRLAADIDDPDRMYDLGYQLIEDGLPAIAATVLRRCYDAVGDSEQVITELVAALEAMMAYRDAAGFLRDLPLLGDSFLCRYLYAFNATLAGDLAVARTMQPRLIPEDRDQEVMAARIAGFIVRADRLAGVAPLDDRDLRGWHHVVTGGVLTHLSPFGFDEPMHGRFAWLQDSAARIVTGVTRLARVLAAWGIAPPCVYAPPGPGHDIVAALVAARFALPLAPWPAVGVPAPGIIAAYDLSTIDPREVPRLLDVRPDQILYAHASPWAVDGPIAADVTTVLCQTLRPPWGPRLTVAGGEVRTELALAGELGADDTAVDDLAGLDRLVAAAGPPAGPRRERLWAGSPVPSNHFD